MQRTRAGAIAVRHNATSRRRGRVVTLNGVPRTSQALDPVPSYSNLFSFRRHHTEPFVVLALGRTGSTTLRRVLTCHPAVSCLHEPFNPDRRRRRGPVTDGTALRRELQKLRTRAGGFKHVWDPDGWPFPSGSALNRELATEPGQRILFLNRRNVLRRLVSIQLSAQAKAWTVDDADRATLRDFPFAPLDRVTLGRLLSRELDTIAGLRRAITASGNPCLDLWYEDLFDPALPVDVQAAKLDEIFAFLGIDPRLSPTERARVWALLRPAGGPLNSDATYRRVPGIDDVEAQFGSDATGHLFR